MARVLEDAGSSIRWIMKIDTYQTDPTETYDALTLRKDYFGVKNPPPSKLVLIPELPVRGASVTTDVIALASDEGLDRQALHEAT